jgi:hypothetical protein
VAAGGVARPPHGNRSVRLPHSFYEKIRVWKSSNQKPKPAPNQVQKKPKNKSRQHPTQAPSKQGKHKLH